jgi:hypothetical protein
MAWFLRRLRVHGRTLRSSGLIRVNRTPTRVNADLHGVQELVLVGDDGGDGTAFDWLVWADPVIQ